MRILVTGCAGRVGTAVVRHLAGRGFDVRGLDVDEPSFDGIDFRTCDLMVCESIAPHLADVDAVLHLAAVAAPGRAPNDRIFSVNCAGTFNVFTACAEADVRRVVVASSINAIGYFFATEPFEIDYLPVDEIHPTFTTDAYSFSKQVTEDIGAYFWRREGISNTCLRFGGGLRKVDEMAQLEGETFRAARSRIEQLTTFGAAAGQEQIRSMCRVYGELRRERTFEPGQWGGLDKVDNRLMIFRHNFFSFVDLGEACRGMELALTAEYEGSHPLFIVDRRNILCTVASELALLFYPDVDLHGELQGDQSFVDWRRAEELIGFRSEVSSMPFYG